MGPLSSRDLRLQTNVAKDACRKRFTNNIKIVLSYLNMNICRCILWDW